MVGDWRKGTERQFTRKNSDEVLPFLLRVGEELANSLDYETTLQSVARQAVPVLADLCVVDLIGSDGRLRPVAAAHVDAVKQTWLREFALGDESPATVLRAFRTRQPLIVPEMFRYCHERHCTARTCARQSQSHDRNARAAHQIRDVHAVGCAGSRSRGVVTGAA